MTEKDIVDFEDKDKFIKDEEKGIYIEKETGKEVGCKICYTRVKAYDYFKSNSYWDERISDPICPICNKYQTYLKANNVVVSESNYSDPKNKIYYTNIYRCEECDKEFCLIPNEVEYDVNHDIYYTGGRDYLTDDKLKPLLQDITKKINDKITNYITRKFANEDTLNDFNFEYWSSNETEKVICELLYEVRVKK